MDRYRHVYLRGFRARGHEGDADRESDEAERPAPTERGCPAFSTMELQCSHGLSFLKRCRGIYLFVITYHLPQAKALLELLPRRPCHLARPLFIREHALYRRRQAAFIVRRHQ